MKLLVNNYTSQIVYDVESEATQKAFDTLVYETINILDPNRFMAPAFKRKYWDGRISVYNQKTHTFPTGLSRYFINLFNTQYAKYPNMVLDIIDNRSDSVRAEVPDIIKLGNGEEPDITLRDYQAEAVKKSYEKQVGIVHLSTNSGKAIANDENIPMADGSFKKVKDVRVGDYLISQDGKPTKVLARYPQPIQMLYRCTFSNHTTIKFTAGHLMPVWINKNNIGDISKLIVISLSEVIKGMAKGNSYDIPTYMPIKYTDGIQTIFSNKHPSQYSLDNQSLELKEVNETTLGDSTCFTVDNKDHLFLVGDYIVTHNTEVASGIIKLAENAIDDDNRIFFMCGSKDIAYQSQARISKRLGGVHVGFWGDGKYDEAQIMVVMVGTVNSALKKPEDVVKLTNNKDKALKKFVTEIYPKLTDKPSIKTTARMLAKNFRVKYKYDEQVLDMIVQIATTSESSNDKHQKALDFWVNKYDKLMQKKGGKVYDKYNNAIELLNSVKICITDECHHSTASTYINVYENMPNARMRIGLTGTVDKKDAIQWWKLQANFVDIISTVRNKEMIDRGVSAKPTVKLLPIEYPQVPQLAQMATQALNPNIPKSQAKLMEYQFIYKEGIINNDYRNQLIVALAERLESQEGTTLIVVNSVEHGDLIQEKLKDSGVTSAFLQGANSTSERNDILDGVKSGKVKTLIGTQLIDEGIDLPNLSYLLYTAGGKSPRQLLQRIGRVLRISDTKKTATIIDFQDRTHPVFSKQADARKRIYLDEQFTIEGD